ncbi:MAG TPA: GPW/gp25 family protein [Acidimicrobiales bacterium]
MAAQDFVGQGWAFPPRVTTSGGIALVRRERELEEAMRIILMTYPGERPMRPAFGCRLRDFVFRSADDLTAAELAQEVRHALAQWEPRVTITAVDVKPDSYDRSMLLIGIEYMIKDENDRRNLVFPFYSIPDDGSEY